MQNNLSQNQIGNYTYLDHFTLRGLSPAGVENRASFAIYIVVNLIVNTIYFALLSSLRGHPDAFSIFFIIWIVYNIYLAICSFMAMIRRLHHIGNSGFFCLLALIPYLNVIFLLYLILRPGKNF